MLCVQKTKVNTQREISCLLPGREVGYRLSVVEAATLIFLKGIVKFFLLYLPSVGKVWNLKFTIVLFLFFKTWFESKIIPISARDCTFVHLNTTTHKFFRHKTPTKSHEQKIYVFEFMNASFERRKYN